MIGGVQPRTIYRISDPVFHTLGMSHVTPTRVMSPTVLMKSSLMHQFALPLRPTSSCDPQPATETSESSSPYKTKEAEAGEPEKRKPPGLRLVDKNRKKKTNPEPVPTEYENINSQLELERTRHEVNPAPQLKKENAKLQAENARLREQLKRKSIEDRLTNDDRMRQITIQEQRYNELVRKYGSLEKEKEHMGKVIGELEGQVRHLKQQNQRIAVRFNQMAQIGQRVKDVEYYCKNLQLQLEKDAQEWKQERRKLEVFHNH